MHFNVWCKMEKQIKSWITKALGDFEMMEQDHKTKKFSTTMENKNHNTRKKFIERKRGTKNKWFHLFEQFYEYEYIVNKHENVKVRKTRKLFNMWEHMVQDINSTLKMVFNWITFTVKDFACICIV